MTFASLSISKEVLIILRLGFVFCSKVILNKKVFFFEDASDKWKRHLGEREIDASEKENKTNSLTKTWKLKIPIRNLISNKKYLRWIVFF